MTPTNPWQICLRSIQPLNPATCTWCALHTVPRSPDGPCLTLVPVFSRIGWFSPKIAGFLGTHIYLHTNQNDHKSSFFHDFPKHLQWQLRPWERTQWQFQVCFTINDAGWRRITFPWIFTWVWPLRKNSEGVVFSLLVSACFCGGGVMVETVSIGSELRIKFLLRDLNFCILNTKQLSLAFGLAN